MLQQDDSWTRSMQACLIESMSKVSLKDFASTFLDVWEKSALPNGSEYSGVDPQVLSKAYLIWETALKLGIDPSMIGTLSLDSRMRIIQYIYCLPGIHEKLLSKEEYWELLQKDLNTYKHMEEKQMPTLSQPESSNHQMISKDLSKEGAKYDNGKLRFDLLPVEAIEDIVAVFTYGANKYADRNWEKGIKYGRVFGAIMRHLWSFWRGEDADPESKHPHLAHAACGFLFLLKYSSNSKDFIDTWDDRTKGERN